jgi:hemerythrin superfamily protein
MANDSGLDAIAMLEAQHRAVERLFEALRQERAGRALVIELADALDGHAAIEEAHFYPALRGHDPEGSIRQAYDEHFEMKQLLLALLEGDLDEEEVARTVEALRGLVASHVEEEEHVIFPRARALLPPPRLEGIAARMRETLAERKREGDLQERVAQDLGLDLPS